MDDAVSATEARIHFGELMRRAVENRETIIVERGGQAHVVVMSVDEYERLVRGQQQDDWRSCLCGGRLGNNWQENQDQYPDQDQ